MKVTEILLAATLIFFAFPAFSQQTEEISGLPVVRDSGQFMIGGRQIALWGISPLAGDQQCWRDERPWDCGEQASFALKHFAEGRMIRCEEKFKKDGGLIAQCFRKRRGGDGEADIAAYLVRHGWAMDNYEMSSGYYLQDQEHARTMRRGIWTSRFQTPEDWCEGNQKYVEYEMAPERKPQEPVQAEPEAQE